MPAPPRRLVVQTCQALLATALVGVVSVPALGVVQLDIVPPTPGWTEARGDTTDVRRAGPRRAVSGAVDRSEVAAEPVTPTVAEVEVEREVVAEQTPGTVVTEPLPVEGYATAGVTWAPSSTYAEEELAVDLRTREAGTWSRWQEVPYDPVHTEEPEDPGAGEAARPGTDAVVLGEVDAVQVRARTTTGEVPEDLEVAVIDPGEDRPADARATAAEPVDTGAANAAAVLSAATRRTAPARPAILSRADWDADERLRDGSPSYGTIDAGFVHHTVNANGYARDQVDEIIRGIYAYHTQSRGWSDIGYNFLVDRFGRIWEGRYGGVGRPVVGAHTLGYNEHSFAMSAIGNFETVSPSPDMLEAYARLFAWKLSLHGVEADATRVNVDGDWFHAISGHRDAGQTACPGRYLYAKLPQIRTRAAAIQRNGTEPPPEPTPDPGTDPVTNLSGSAWPDIAVKRPGGQLSVTRTEGQLRFERSVNAADGWDARDLVVAAGDLTGDGVGDLLARNPARERTTLHPGDGDGGLRPALRHYTKFNDLDQLVGVGDHDGDGDRDLVGRVRGTGELRLYPGTGDGGFARAVVLARTWPYDRTVAAGDLDGDGRGDLLGRAGGELFLRAGRAGGLAAPVRLAGTWSGHDVLSGGRDLTGDGVPDLLARERASLLTYVHPGNGAGGYGRRLGPFSAFRGLRWFALGGQLAGNRAIDVVGVRADNGALKITPNTGRRNLGLTLEPGVDLAGATSVVAVGDWNRDGHGDLMYRAADEGLMFLAGQGDDSYAAAVPAGSDLPGVTGLVAAGDLTGDGRADLLGQAPNGAVRVYPGDGAHGFRPGFAARTGEAAPAGRHDGVVLRRRNGSVWLWRLAAGGGPMTSRLVAEDANGYDWFLALGDADGNGSPDVLAREAGTGLLWLLPVDGNALAPRRYVGDQLDGPGVAG